MITKDRNTLLVLGNGFDRSLNLETSYQEFLNSEEFQQAYIESIKDHTTRNLFQFLKNRNQLNNWVDVELDLKRFALELNAHEKADEYVANNLKKDFNAIKAALSDYLKRVVGTFSGNFNNDFAKFYEKFCKDSIDVISFNYTNTFNSAIVQMGFDALDYKRVFNIHGTIEKNDIIFGIDEPESSIGDKITFLEKSYHRNYNPQKAVALLHNANDLYFFGVSLGETDRHYFQTFFDYLLGDSTKKNFWFSFYGDDGYSYLYNRLKHFSGHRTHQLRSSHSIKFYNCIDCNYE